VVAAALGFHHTTTTRQTAYAWRDVEPLYDISRRRL